ncbi:MAG: response regulator [Myxococcota bacterium]
MAEKTGEGITALVTDDNADIREVLAAVLADFGCRVLTAANGEEAIAHLEKENVSIQLLDLQMPRLDGFGVLAQMRERANELAQPLTIIVTANADVDGRIRGTELGALDFVEKPFRVPAVRLRVDRLIAMVRMERGVGDEEASLQQMRTRDPVTGTGTFAMLRPVLESHFQIAQVTQSALSCIVLCDDSYNLALADGGVPAGEERLKTIAAGLKRLLRGADILCRIDAAEFVILLPGTDAAGARGMMNAIIDELQPLNDGGATLSLANATFPHPQMSKPNHLFRAASVTLAQARSRLNERIAFFETF